MAVLSRLDILLHADTARATQDIRQFGSDANSAFASIRQNAVDMGGKIKAGIGVASAAISGASTAIGFLVKDQIELANQLTKTAQIANTSATNIQKYTVAAKAMGIEQDKLGDIFKDTQDKVGDFLSTGGGELQDFFNNVAPKIGLTAEELRKMSGPDALQAIYNGLEKANLSQSEKYFYMESISDEASLLIPLLQKGGEGFKLWATAAENAGAVMDEKTIRATQELNTTTELLNLSVQGAKNQIAQAFLPVLSDLASELVKDATLKKQAAEAGQWLAKGFKIIAMTGVGVVAIVTSIGKAIGGVMAAFAQFGKVAEGVDLTSPFAMFQIAKNIFWNIPTAQLDILKNTVVDIGSTISNANQTMNWINNLGNGVKTNPLVSQLTTTTNAVQGLKNAYGETGAQIQANKKAAEEAAKAQEKAAKAQAKSIANPLVSNSSLSGLKIKSAEATAGGRVHQATADFAKLVQNTLGSSLKYFSAFNDRYHQGRSSDHNKGMAFDIVMQDAKQAKGAVAQLQQLANQYGFVIKTIDEYAKPSKHSTGGHIHVSVKAYAGQVSKSIKATAKATNDYQMMVFNAWKNAGLSDAQAKAFTAEVGRENDYAPKNLFGAHTDLANRKQNLGMISWQGARKTALVKYLKDAGLIKNGSIEQSQDALNAQAAFALNDILNDPNYTTTKNEFLANKDIAYEAAYKVLGDNYIRWDRNGSSVLGAKKAAEHAAKRDKYYNEISAKVGIGDSVKDWQQQVEDDKKLAEQQANARLSIEREYAGKVRQVELKLAEDIQKIKEANFSAVDEAKYIEAAKTRADIEIREYKAAQAEKINSLKDYQLSEEQKIRDKWQRERDAITNNAEYQLAENAAIKEQLLKAIDDKEQYELSQYRITQSQKLSAMTDFNKSELQQIKDRYAYEQLLLQQQPASDDRDIEMAVNQAKQAKEIADLQKQHRDSAVSLYDSLTGNSELTQLKTDLESRKKLLEDAYKNEAITQAEYNAMKLESERAYYEQHRQLRTAQMEAVAGNMTQIMGDLVGKQSKAYRIMFAIEKGFAIARSVMAIQTGIAQAAALPFPANIPAMMSVAAATANIISTIQSVRQPQIEGQAHDGLSYIPREGTYLLDKGERVIKPRDNQRLTQFLDSQPKQLNSNNPALNVQIHNNAPVDVTTRQGDNGELIMMIEERVRQSWQRAGGNPNSHEAKMLKRGFNVRPNRG